MTPAAPGHLRVFAALELPSAWLTTLATLTAELKPRLSREALRWVRPEGIHLTLKFYGEVKPDLIAGIQDSLRQAAAGAAPFELQLTGLGVFPSARAPRVLWVGVAGDLAALGRLQQAVEAGARPLGFQPEARGFSPHLTLGRFRGRLDPTDQRALAEVLARPVAGAGAFHVTELGLIRSDLQGPRGPVYSQLLRVALGSPAA